MLTSLHKDLTTPYKSNSLFFFIKAEAHSLAEELRLCCLCIRYKLARRDGFVGGLSLSYQGQAFILAIAMCKANTSRSVNLGTIRVTFHVEAEVWATSRTDFLKK